MTIVEKRTCKISGEVFTITDRDLEFYKKIDVPLPTLSPFERRRRRFAFRNERFLYKRTSSLSDADLIACVHPDELWQVYSREEWFSDKWDGVKFGRDYDFNKPFFEQYYELQKQVPTIAINGFNNENSSYANYAAACKNCHLIFGSVYCEDCLYGNPYYCRSCIDSLLVRDSELCYECVTCERCYECFHCQDCTNSFELMYCYDCHGCKNSIGCSGLRKKEYYIFNKQYSKEDFLKAKEQLDLCNQEQVVHIQKRFNEIKSKTPRRFAVTLNTENVSGNYIYSSKNTLNCFDVQRCEDVSYSAQVIDMKDCYDCNYTEENELCYEYICNYHNQRCLFSFWMYSCSDIWYSSYCRSSQNLFGCIGLHQKHYCILNKQYSKNEYEDLKNRIVQHMKEQGMYGEFFPVWTSLFPYNETVAQEYFPLTKEEALARSYRWREKDPREYAPQTYTVAKNIDEVPDSIVNEVLACAQCGKNFRLERREVAFYKNYRLPVPSKCPDCRHKARLALKNPRTLFSRTCTKCGTEIKTSYSPERNEPIYCENCYLKTTY